MRKARYTAKLRALEQARYGHWSYGYELRFQWAPSISTAMLDAPIAVSWGGFHGHPHYIAHCLATRASRNKLAPILIRRPVPYANFTIPREKAGASWEAESARAFIKRRFAVPAYRCSKWVSTGLGEAFTPQEVPPFTPTAL